MKQRLWIIALKYGGEKDQWGDNWAYNRTSWHASKGSNIFLNISEVKNWLDEHEEFWMTDGRELCVYCEEFEL